MEKEKKDCSDWRNAPGVLASKNSTNPTLAKRDYSFVCGSYGVDLICVHHGYHFWWCRVHYQPLYQCEIDRLKIKMDKMDALII